MTFISNIVAVSHAARPWSPTAYLALNELDKFRYLMHQAVIINFIDRTYDTAVPLVLTDYKRDVVTRFKIMRDTYESFKTSSYAWVPWAKKMIPYIEYFLCGGRPQGEADEVIEFLSLTDTDPVKTKTVPWASVTPFYVPYVRWALSVDKAKLAGSSYAKSDAFSVPGPVALATLSFNSTTVVVRCDTEFPGYKFSPKETLSGASSPDYVSSIFGFLEGFDHSGKSLMSALGVLASMALELDANLLSNSNGPAWVYYKLYSKLFGWTSTLTTQKVRSVDRPLSESPIGQDLLTYLTHLQDRYSVTISDGGLLATVLAHTPPTPQEKLVQEFFELKLKQVSVEAFQAFQQSGLSKFKGLVRSATDPKDKEEEPDAPKDPTDAPETGTTGDAEPKTTSDPKADAPAGDDSAPASDTPTKTDAAPGDSPEGNPTDETPNSLDPKPDDTDPSATPSTDTQSRTQHTPVESVPGSSDKSGIVIQLAGDETLDSYLVREEIGTKVTAILANPPKSMSLEQRKLLKWLMAYWINLLSIKTVCDIVAYANITLTQAKR